MDFSESFEGPVIERIGGEDVSFPPLLIDDYLPWINEETGRRRKLSEKSIPRASAREEHEMKVAAASLEVGLETISAMIWTVPGSKRVLGISLAKAGVPLDRQTAILKAVRPGRLHGLAAEVSNLFERRAPLPQVEAAKPVAEGDPDPNSSSAASESSLPAENETGSVTGS